MYSACNVYNQLIETVRAGSQSTAIQLCLLSMQLQVIFCNNYYCIASIYVRGFRWLSIPRTFILKNLILHACIMLHKCCYSAKIKSAKTVQKAFSRKLITWKCTRYTVVYGTCNMHLILMCTCTSAFWWSAPGCICLTSTCSNPKECIAIITAVGHCPCECCGCWYPTRSIGNRRRSPTVHSCVYIIM